ncbi:uncharacterized protein LOC114239332 [Bombyx mandarina]|uniref:Uncharacterized protein LOC114239332 n=1 Tax=Bombyx mandarina TaxID=7092 RepID=A0A6J2J7B6_BOMMA|nr:uncharacterized protein LOC114239332 [Bombyx mandarina]
MEYFKLLVYFQSLQTSLQKACKVSLSISIGLENIIMCRVTKMKFVTFLMITIWARVVLTKDANLVDFLKTYVDNERKPTMVVLTGLCWKKDTLRTLVVELSKLGARTSKPPSIKIQSKYHVVMHNTLFLSDLHCPETAEVIETAILHNLFRYPLRWLLLKNMSENSSVILEDIPAFADSDLVLAEITEELVVITECKIIILNRNVLVHKPNENGALISKDKGYYNGTMVDVRPHRELFKRRRDVMGRPLTMANVIQDSNSTRYHLPREDALELQYDVIPKICWMTAKLAFQMLNATPRYTFSYRWGYKVNGQWSGMINDLHTSKADLGTNCVVSDVERLSVVTYTDMLAPFRVRFVFRQPPLPSVANIFYLPFAGSVWAAVAVCAMVYTVAMYWASKWEFNLEKRSASQFDGTVGDAMLLTMSALSQQGCFIEPKRAPVENSLYKDPVRVMIHKRIDPETGNGQFYSLEDGVDMIRQGFFAFHSIVEPVYRRIEETFLETEKCDLTEVDFLSSFDPFVPVKKDSPYLELLRVVFKQIRESGIQSALNKRYQVPKPRCSNKVAAFSSVGIVDLRPVLILMVYGIISSCLILIMEMIVFKIAHH